MDRNVTVHMGIVAAPHPYYYSAAEQPYLSVSLPQLPCPFVTTEPVSPQTFSG